MKGVKGFKKGEGGRRKGSLNKETIEREQRREIFDAEISNIWLDTIKKLPSTYVADQFMGKAADVIKHTIKVEATEKTKQIAELLKKLDEA